MSKLRTDQLSPVNDSRVIDVSEIIDSTQLGATTGAGLIGTSTGETQQQINDRVRKGSLTNIYVAATGSNANSGASASPFLTLQAAIDYIYSRQSTTDITINIGAGSFAGATISGSLPYGIKINIVGSGASSTTINSTLTVSNLAVVTLSGVKITTTSGMGLISSRMGSLSYQNVEFGSVAGTAHVYQDTYGAINITGNYSVTAAAGSFHYWNRCGIGNMSVNPSICSISNNPAFSSFVYFEENATVYCNGWSYTGSTTGGRFVITQNAVVEPGVLTAAQRDVFFPGDHNTSDTSVVDQPNVGGKFGAYPDYGFTTLQTITATGLSSVEFTKIPDCFTQIFIQWSGVNVGTVGANFIMQFKPAGQTAYQTSASYYQILDFAGTSPARPSAASAINTSAKISGGADCYGSICLNGFHGGAYPLVSGNYTDNANVFHTVQGIFLDPNWIRNIKITPSSGTFSSGTFNLVAVF